MYESVTHPTFKVGPKPSVPLLRLEDTAGYMYRGQPGHSYLCWDTPHVLDTKQTHRADVHCVDVHRARRLSVLRSRFSIDGPLAAWLGER